MRDFVTIVFDNAGDAYKGLHALWALDDEGGITVHGTAVVHRDSAGRFEVDTKETHPILATAVGAGIGALLGALAGPVGLAIGATTGGLIGGAADLERSDTRQQAALESGFVLGRGQSAVIADVSEGSSWAIRDRMKSLGGTIYRRSRSSVESDAGFDNGFYPYDDYLYPYEYIPNRSSPHYGW